MLNKAAVEVCFLNLSILLHAYQQVTAVQQRKCIARTGGPSSRIQRLALTGKPFGSELPRKYIYIYITLLEVVENLKDKRP